MAQSSSSVSVAASISGHTSTGASSVSAGFHPAPGIKPTTSSSTVQSPSLTMTTRGQLDPSYNSVTDTTQFPMQQPTKTDQKQTSTVPLTTTNPVTLSDTLGGSLPSQQTQTLTSTSLHVTPSSVDIKSVPDPADSSKTVLLGNDSLSATVSTSGKQNVKTGAHVLDHKTSLHSSHVPSKTIQATTSTMVVPVGPGSQSRLSPSASGGYTPATGQVLEPITASKTVYNSGSIPTRTSSTMTPTPAPPVTPSLKPMETEQSTILGGGLSDYIVYVGIPACGLLLLILLILCICCVCCRKKKNKGSPAKNMMQDLWVNSQPEISLSTRQPLIEAAGGDRMCRQQQDLGCTQYEAVFDFQAESDTHVSLHQGELVKVLRKETNGWWRGTVGDKTGWFPCSYVQAAPQDKLETENEVEMHNDSHLSSFMGIQRPHSLRDSYPTEEEIGTEPIYCKIQPKDKRKSDVPLSERPQPKPVEPVVLKENNISTNISTKLAEDTRFITVYTYEAKAKGEISLTEGDLIIGREQDTNGWTNGFNETTKEEGWFPSVYVDKLESEGTEVAAEPGSYKQLDANTRAGDQPWLGIVHRARHDFRAEKAGDLEFDKGDLVTVLQVLENGWWLGCKDKSVGWFPGSFVQLLDEPPSPIDPCPPSVAPPRLETLDVPESKLTPSPQKKSRLRPARKAPPPPPNAETSALPSSKIPSLASSKIPKKAEKVSAPVPPFRAPATKPETTDSVSNSYNMDISEPKLLSSDGLYELIPDAQEKAERPVEKKPTNKPRIPVRYIKPKLVQIPRHEVELPNVSGYNRDSMSCELSPPREQALPDQNTSTPDSDSYLPPAPVAQLSPNEPLGDSRYHKEGETDVSGFFHLPPQNLVSPFRQESVDDEPESPPYRAFSSFGASSFGSSFGKKDTTPSIKPPQKKSTNIPIVGESPSKAPQTVFVPEDIEAVSQEEDLCDEVFREIENQKPNEISHTESNIPVSRIPTSPKPKEKPVSKLQPPKHINLSVTNEPERTPSSDSSTSEQFQTKNVTPPISRIPKGPSSAKDVYSKDIRSETKVEDNSFQPLLEVDNEHEGRANGVIKEKVVKGTMDDVDMTSDSFDKFVNQDREQHIVKEPEKNHDVITKPRIVPKPLPKPKPETVVNTNPVVNDNAVINAYPVVNDTPPSMLPKSVASTPDSSVSETPPTTPHRKEKLSESENETDNKTKDKPKVSKLPLGSKIAQKSPQLRGRKSKIPASPKVRPKNSEHQENLVNMNKTLEQDSPISTPVISSKQKPASLQLKNLETDMEANENEKNLRNRSKSPQEKVRGIPTPLRNRSNSPSASKLAKPRSIPGSPATPTSKQSGLATPKKVTNGLPGRESPSTRDPDRTRGKMTPSPEMVLDTDTADHSDQMSPKPNRPSKPPKIPVQKGKDGKPARPAGKSLLPMVQKSLEGSLGVGSPGTNSKLPKRSGIPSAKPPRPPPPKSQQDEQEDLSPKKSLFQAVKGYTAQCDGELSFAEGTFIMELSDCDRKGWYMGMLADGTTGLYPRDHFHASPMTATHSEA